MTSISPEPSRYAWIAELFRLSTHMVHGTLEQVLQQMVEHVVTGFGATSGTLALADNDGRTLTMVAGVGPSARFLGQVITYGQGIMGTVAAEGQPLLLSGDLSTDPRYARLAAPREGARPVSALCWPLHIQNQLVGVMSLNRSASDPPFSARDMEEGQPVINLIALVIDNIRLYAQQQEHIQELSTLNDDLKQMNQALEETHSQLLQSEKMAAIGQLAAGVAHEINNPIGYINSNIGTLQNYVGDLFRLIDGYAAAEAALVPGTAAREGVAARQGIDVAYLKQDIRELLCESLEGVTRVSQIVRDLKDFSHADNQEWSWADLHAGLDKTLKIVHNEIKYKAEVIKEYGDIPQIECRAQQINQVFMNLLVNAAHAIAKPGTIWIRTGAVAAEVWVEIEDTGEGIKPENISRIFEPFYTTKPLGQGTGLGLSLSYGIVRNHGGRLEVSSTVGRGSRFRIWLPQRRTQVEGSA